MKDEQRFFLFLHLLGSLPQKASLLLTNLETGLPTYAFLGVFIADAGLYLLCYVCSPLFTLGDVTFLYKLTGKELFPVWGFVLPFVTASVAAYFTYSSLKIPSYSYRLVRMGIGHLIVTAGAFTFLPFSVTAVVAHVAVVAVSAVAASVKTLLGPEIEDTNDRRSLQLRHRRLLTLVSQAFWGMITVVLGGVAWLIGNPWAQQETEALAWVFQQGRIVFGFGLILYFMAGMGFYVMFPLYFDLIDIERHMKHSPASQTSQLE